MDRDKGPLTFLKKWLFKNDGEKKQGKTYYLLMAILIGVAVMLIGSIFSKKDEPNDRLPVFQTKEENQQPDVAAFGDKSSKKEDIIAQYEHSYERQLKEALELILGVNDVKVIVNIDAGEKQILEKNAVTTTQTTEETDPQGGKRTVEDVSTNEQVVIIRNGDKEAPITVETRKPKVRGVLVVAEGAENIQVKKWVIEAVTRVLDVPNHRVAVMPKKTKGE